MQKLSTALLNVHFRLHRSREEEAIGCFVIRPVNQLTLTPSTHQTLVRALGDCGLSLDDVGEVSRIRKQGILFYGKNYTRTQRRVSYVVKLKNEAAVVVRRFLFNWKCKRVYAEVTDIPVVRDGILDRLKRPLHLR